MYPTISLPVHSSPARSPWNRLQLKGDGGGGAGVLLETKILIFSDSDVPLGVLAFQPPISASLLSVVVTDEGRDHSCSSKSRPQSHRVHRLQVQGGMVRVCRGMKPQNLL